jgi:outer membrane protein TolC
MAFAWSEAALLAGALLGALPEARRARLDWLLARKFLAVLEQQRDHLGRVVSLNEARFGEGVIAERDLIKARLERSRAEIELSRAGVALESAERNLLQLQGSKLEPEADFDLPLPLDRDRLGALARRSKAAEVDAAAAAYEAAREQIGTFKLRLLQQAEESLSIEIALYEQLKTPLTSLLEAVRSRTGIQLDYYRTLHQAATARLRLAELLGEEALP